jgi:hypothetical protein
MNTRYRAYKVLIVPLLSLFIMNCSLGQVLNIINTKTPTPTISPTQTTTITLAPIKTKVVTITSLITPTFEGISIIGMWERHGKMENRAYTEHMNIMADGTYHVEANYDDNGDVIASMDGTYTFDKVNIYYIDKTNKKTTESYKLNDLSNTLIINNDTAHPWKRAK